MKSLYTKLGNKISKFINFKKHINLRDDLNEKKKRQIKKNKMQT
jgi:hypothetical protein